MKQIETVCENGTAQTRIIERTALPDDGHQETDILNLYPSERFQTLLGFGGAFTEAAGYVFAQMPEAAQKQMLNDYFGSDGLGYTLGRSSIDSCDFGLGNYSAVTDPADKELKTFSLSRDEQYILPLCRAAQLLQPNLRWMLSPWSPPAFMKSNHEKNHGGKLLPEYRALWAEYLCRYVDAYQKRGLPVFALSIQNEPNAVQAWDSCVYSADEEQDFAVNFLAPAIAAHELNNLTLTIWDHNKERLFDRVNTICGTPSGRAAVGGIGYHWYSGDHFEAVSLTAQKYPEKTLIFTEGCIEYSKFSAQDGLQNAQKYAHEIIGSFNAGMHAFMDWNLFLDVQGGPNHVGNYCDAPIMADIAAGTYHRNLSYNYIGHFSRYLRPGAVRVGSTRFTDCIELTAAENPDGTLTAIALNRGTESIVCYLRVLGLLYPITLASQSISTLILPRGE